jgi:hypothetical protein
MSQDLITGGREEHQAKRNVWIVTGYGIAALALLGVLAYAVSTYAVR